MIENEYSHYCGTLSALHHKKTGIYYIIMRQIYYVIRTLLRGRSSNVVKVISLGLGLTMSILLFARVAFEQSFDKCFKDYENLYQVFSIFTMNGEQLEPQDQNCGPVAGAILENFPKEVEAATSYCLWVNDPLYHGSVRFEVRKLAADSLFFPDDGNRGLKRNSGERFSPKRCSLPE